jgi:hypothetical protein
MPSDLSIFIEFYWLCTERKATEEARRQHNPSKNKKKKRKSKNSKNNQNNQNNQNLPDYNEPREILVREEILVAETKQEELEEGELWRVMTSRVL